MAIYKPKRRLALSEIRPEERLANQVIFSGSSGNVLSVPKGTVFLEVLIMAAGTAIISDGDGAVISTGVKDFEQDHSPLRCDGGITLSGDIAFAKAFVIHGLFAE